MMPGIEILNTIETTTTPTWLIIIIISCLLFAAAYAFFGDSDNIMQAILAIISALVFLAFMILAPIFTIPNGIQYQVLIDEEVNLIEFNEKYEILDIEGKIYTIKERDKD